MANVYGNLKTTRGRNIVESTRTGAHYIEAEIKTWGTTAKVSVLKNGKVHVQIERNGAVVHLFDLEVEGRTEMASHDFPVR